LNSSKNINYLFVKNKLLANFHFSEVILDEEQKEFMIVDWEMSKNKSEELYFNATGNEISANRGMWKRKKIQKECSPNAKYCAIFQCSDAKLGMAKGWL
jgi:hypothetical protein